jgi:hypothetical protein
MLREVVPSNACKRIPPPLGFVSEKAFC